MSVASHLDTTPEQYDVKIRTLIPYYDELIAEAAGALRLASRKVERIVDLGIGTGTLAKACLQVMPKARVLGIDADPAMMQMVAVRLGVKRKKVTLQQGDFTSVAIPECDAITGSYAFHHIRDMGAKLKFYRRAFQALRPGGVLISGDCNPASTAEGVARGLEVWFEHLGRTYGRAKGKKIYESWGDEDFYVPLMDEVRMLERAGFVVEVPWRRSPLTVIAAVKLAARG